ncbi:hypothetical protein C0995_001953, partial [Termitomyces sp. Mi166
SITSPSRIEYTDALDLVVENLPLQAELRPQHYYAPSAQLPAIRALRLDHRRVEAPIRVDVRTDVG